MTDPPTYDLVVRGFSDDGFGKLLFAYHQRFGRLL